MSVVDTLSSQSAIAGVAALHHDVEGWCGEDGHAWPCKTIQLIRIAQGVS